LPQSSNLQFQLIDLYSYYTSTPYFKVLYEHHFDVFFTNKIPYVRKLKLKNVAGCRAFHYNGNIYYAEAFVGFENILNFFRVDYVFSLTKLPNFVAPSFVSNNFFQPHSNYIL
jgi:hypothetical protein